MTTPDPTSAAGTTAARELIAHLIWDHQDTGSNDRDRTVAEHQADEIMAMLHANGMQIAGPGEICLNCYDAITAMQCIQGIAKQHRDLGSSVIATIQEAVATRINAVIARVAGEETI